MIIHLELYTYTSSDLPKKIAIRGDGNFNVHVQSVDDSWSGAISFKPRNNNEVIKEVPLGHQRYDIYCVNPFYSGSCDVKQVRFIR